MMYLRLILFKALFGKRVWGLSRDWVIPKCCNKTLMAKLRFVEFNLPLMKRLGLDIIYILKE